MPPRQDPNVVANAEDANAEDVEDEEEEEEEEVAADAEAPPGDPVAAAALLLLQRGVIGVDPGQIGAPDGNIALAGGPRLPQSEIGRLTWFKGNTKDTITAEAWIDQVDRHITVLHWSPEQTAGAAIEAMREDANIWRENLGYSSETKPLITDWTLLRPVFLARFTKLKNRAARVQALGQLKQGNESVHAYHDRVTHSLNKLTALKMSQRPAGPRTEGYLECREDLQAAIFLCGLKPELKTAVETELEETSSLKDILKRALKVEQAHVSRSTHKMASMEMGEDGGGAQHQGRDMAEIKDLIRSMNPGGATEAKETVAAFKAGSKPKKKGTVNSIPMATRTNAILCWKCKQWGKHLQTECKLSSEAIGRLTPQTKDDRPSGQVYDTQFPNA